MKLRATLLATGGKTTGIEIAPEVIEALGGGKKSAVNATINGFTYRSSIGSMGGKFMLPVSAERRAAAGVAAGDEVELELTLDAAPREIEVPADLAAALAESPKARARFEALSFSHKQQHVLAIEGAKTAETRARRVAKAVEALVGEA